MVTVTGLPPSCGDNPQEGTVNTDVSTFKKGAIYIARLLPCVEFKMQFFTA